MSDQLIAETLTGQHTTLATNIHAPCGIRTLSLSRRAAADLHLRLRTEWNQPFHVFRFSYSFCHLFIPQSVLCRSL